MNCNPTIPVQDVVGKTVYMGVFSTFNARSVTFDFSAWAEALGDGTFSVSLLRPGETVPYTVAGLSVDGTLATWTFDATDTALAGYGRAFLGYVTADAMDMTVDFDVYIAKNSAPAEDTPPDPLESWYQQMLEAAAQAQTAAENAEASAEAAAGSAAAAEEASARQPYPNPDTGTWWIWDAAAGAYIDSGVYYGAGTYVHRQAAASETWTVYHSLGKYPSVTVVDSTGRVVYGGVEYQDANTVILTFSGAFSGVAYLN